MSLLLIWICFASAEPKYAYPPQQFAAKGIERLHVEGIRGALTLQGKPGRFFRAAIKHGKSKSSDDWHLVIERRQDTLHIEVFNVLYGQEWKRHVKQELWPEFDVEIEGPARPAQISWRDGRMDIRDWAAPVEASLLKGQVLIERGTSRLGLQAVEADVHVRGFVGEISLKGERGPVRISGVRGKLDLNWLSGTVKLDKMNGKVTVEAQDGELTATRGSGQWELKVLRGIVKLDGFAGQLKAIGDSSRWTIAAQNGADVEIVTEKGPVDVQWSDGGPKFFLSTREGRIRVPEPFKVEDRDGFQVVEARKGEKPKGHLFVRTTSGPISFR